MTLEEETRRGEQAQRLITDPLLQESFTTVEAALLEAWLATSEDQTADRERLWLMLRLFGRLKSYLNEALETGKLATQQLTERQARRMNDG